MPFFFRLEKKKHEISFYLKPQQFKFHSTKPARYSEIKLVRNISTLCENFSSASLGCGHRAAVLKRLSCFLISKRKRELRKFRYYFQLNAESVGVFWLRKVSHCGGITRTILRLIAALAPSSFGAKIIFFLTFASRVFSR